MTSAASSPSVGTWPGWPGRCSSRSTGPLSAREGAKVRGAEPAVQRLAALAPPPEAPRPPTFRYVRSRRSTAMQCDRESQRPKSMVVKMAVE